SLITNQFSLADAAAADRPTLYFNYFLDTQGASSLTDTMRDSARVFISSDGGNTWKMLATNNSVLDATPVANGGNRDSEMPEFRSTSETASLDTGVNGRQRVQDLYDNTGVWRQARISLGEFAGQS